jgi:hypothetical protein
MAATMILNSNIAQSKIYIAARLLVYIITPVVLLILPKDYFDKGESVCLSKVLFDIECYGCGMTRACMHLIHLDWEDAYYFNPLAFIVLPILACLWAWWFRTDLLKLRSLLRQPAAF